MADTPQCACGRHEVDTYEVRIMHDGVHAVSGCQVDDEWAGPPPRD